MFSLGLAQAGEFGFVLLSVTVADGVLPKSITDQLLLVVAISMLLTPLLFIVQDSFFASRFAKQQDKEQDTIEEENNIIIAGRGRVGGTIDRLLRAAGFNATVIDYNSQHLEMLQKFGVRHTYFGDATRPDLLHSAGIEDAKVLIVSIDEKESINALVSYAIRHHPDLTVIARAIDRDHVYELWALGCREIIRETVDSSLRMGRVALESLGFEKSTASKIVDAYFDNDRMILREAADSYDPSKPTLENTAYIQRIRDNIEGWNAQLVEDIKEITGSNDSTKS